MSRFLIKINILVLINQLRKVISNVLLNITNYLYHYSNITRIEIQIDISPAQHIQNRASAASEHKSILTISKNILV